ncbi:hypothetical protein [uncultured Lacinutrix sp.]|uniref:hypothetical protein n=1 Tax=uncultured Lacinutrix sp. TaxID=574032 RepID=UPI00260D3E00|nr:hypothetical protein [uncultured Lacinutrix sp.]
MKLFSLKYKVTAIILAFTFVSLSLHSISSHTYTTGIDNYHYEPNCHIGAFKTHLSQNCINKNSVHF